MNKWIKMFVALCWIAGLSLLFKFAYGATFGTDTFGTGLFGTGTSTTSTYAPGYHRTIIIGGGLVKLMPGEIENKYDVILFDKLMLQEEEEWERLLD